MANVILFTDRSPESSGFDKMGWSSKMYNLSAGAYKVASHLRDRGYSVLVISDCLGYSFSGLQEIIKNNSNDLLWVGISTTFLPVRSDVERYQLSWASDSDFIIKNNLLFGQNNSFYQGGKQLPWGTRELNLISSWLKQTYNAPFLIGGSWVTTIKNGNLSDLNDNCFVVSGKAELYVERFTAQRSADKNTLPEYVNNNTEYDNHDYKFSRMHWQQHDFIAPGDWLPLEISRGCAFNCAYCDYDRKATFDNYKNPETLLQELLYNYEKFGITKYNLLDDLYNDSKEKVRELYEKVWSKLPFQAEWTSYMRLDMIWADPESADILKASGARIGSFGIETLHDRAGKRVGKGLGRDRILKTLERLKSVWGTDTLSAGLFIAGLPFEPRESIQETMAWVKDTDLLYTYSFTPMWISPPSHFDILNKLHSISLDNEKYGITWPTKDSWINSEGITFKEADEMAQWINAQKPLGMRINHGQYSDLRSAGLSHNEILKIKIDPESMMHRVEESNQIKNQKVDDRMLKVLQLNGI